MATISFSKQWRWLAGYSHALPQRPLQGHIQVRGATARDVTDLDARLQPVVPAPGLPPPSGPPAQALARRVLYWAGEIQRHARIAVSPALHLRERPAPDPRAGALFEVALPCRSARASQEALVWLEQTVNQHQAPTAAQQGPVEASLQQLLDRLRAYAEPGYNQLHLLQAAYRRGVCVTPLGKRLLRLGTGARSHLMDSTITDQTPALAVSIAKDKWVTVRLLSAIGVPTPQNERVSSADEAVALAHKLGFPVVVKPADSDQGRGVSAHLLSDESVRKAFAEAQAVSPKVLLERHVHGFGHRLTLLNGELVAVLRRIPGGVTGDGQHSVAQLLALNLASPEVQRQRNLGRVQLDAQALEMLAERGLSPDSVPAVGEFVLLRRRDNISAGGRLEHLSAADVHPDNLLAAQRAARALHLDLAGVDFLSTDIGQSWRDNGGAICEVNAQPQVGVGARGDNYDRMLQHLLGDQPQIPLHLLLYQGNPPDLHAELHALRGRLGLQALSHRDGLWLNDTQLLGPQPDGWQAARAALADRDVGSLLMALTPEEIVSQGLPAPHIDGLHLAPGLAEACTGDAANVLKQALQWCAVAPSSGDAGPGADPSA